MQLLLRLYLVAAIEAAAVLAASLHAFERDVTPSKRPDFAIGPFHPGVPFPESPPRNRTCVVQSNGDEKKDDSEYIIDAIRRCNNGGHVIFSRGTKYMIGTALDLTFLKHIDLGKSKPFPRSQKSQENSIVP